MTAKLVALLTMDRELVVQGLLEWEHLRFLFLLFGALLLKSYFIGDVSYHDNKFVLPVDLNLLFLQDDGATISRSGQLYVKRARLVLESLQDLRGG